MTEQTTNEWICSRELSKLSRTGAVGRFVSENEQGQSDINTVSSSHVETVSSGITKSTLYNIKSCNYSSINLRVLHEICQSLDISLKEFFNSDIFNEENLEP